jgi:hypothetical protein
MNFKRVRSRFLYEALRPKLAANCSHANRDHHATMCPLSILAQSTSRATDVLDVTVRQQACSGRGVSCSRTGVRESSDVQLHSFNIWSLRRKHTAHSKLVRATAYAFIRSVEPWSSTEAISEEGNRPIRQGMLHRQSLASNASLYCTGYHWLLFEFESF